MRAPRSRSPSTSTHSAVKALTACSGRRRHRERRSGVRHGLPPRDVPSTASTVSAYRHSARATCSCRSMSRGTPRRRVLVFRRRCAASSLRQERQVAAHVRPEASPGPVATVSHGQDPVGARCARVRTDGTLYASEILNGHRMLDIRPEGQLLKKSIEPRVRSRRPTLRPDAFMFPNSIRSPLERGLGRRQQQPTHQGLLSRWRVQALSGHTGPASRVHVPPAQERRKPSAWWSSTRVSQRRDDMGRQEGREGPELRRTRCPRGQFAYRRTSRPRRAQDVHHRHVERCVQVWGWRPRPHRSTPQTPLQWLICLSPLLLLPLLLLLVASGSSRPMTSSRRWLPPEEADLMTQEPFGAGKSRRGLRDASHRRSGRW